MDVRVSGVENSAGSKELEGRPFAVADSVYCCWDFDPKASTLEYLEGIDPDYFATVATLLAGHLESENAIASSVALRVLYHQGVETLLSLLGAAAQGPTVVPAWIDRCKTEDLKNVTARLQSGEPLLTEAGSQSVTFEELSAHVLRFVWAGESEPETTAAHFARFWHRLSNELLDEKARAEYNALKHGTRVLPGGFSLFIEIEADPSGPAVAPEMHRIGGSRFGSTFFATEPVRSAKWHIRTRRTSLNWLPEPMVQRLELVSMSIANVVGALRCDLGIDPVTVKWSRPASPEAFQEVWRQSPGVASGAFGPSIGIAAADELSREDLRTLLQARTGQHPPA